MQRRIGSEVDDVRVAVDLSKCFGHARCEDLCPEVFATDPVEGKCVIRDPEVPPGLREKVLLAVRNCPERALETSSGEGEKS
jgi:ferredoxin